MVYFIMAQLEALDILFYPLGILFYPLGILLYPLGFLLQAPVFLFQAKMHPALAPDVFFYYLEMWFYANISCLFPAAPALAIFLLQAKNVLLDHLDVLLHPLDFH